jgi:peptidoglycan/xylan/chitin deacetylase (PgdA/CDA1 family)
MLLHKIEALDTVELLYRFSRFSDIQVFKPAKKHAIRSTFYLIAKNVEPNAEAARQAVEAWKEAWWNATFGGVEGVGASKIDIKDDYAQSVIDNFGDELARLARPVWRIQADALSKTAFVH